MAVVKTGHFFSVKNGISTLLKFVKIDNCIEKKILKYKRQFRLIIG